MHLNHSHSIIIDSCNLLCGQIYHKNITLENSSKSIIRGHVYDYNKMPCAGAVIEIIEINPSTNERTVLGYSYTDKNGKYLFALDTFLCTLYEFAIYSPLNS